MGKQGSIPTESKISRRPSLVKITSRVRCSSKRRKGVEVELKCECPSKQEDVREPERDHAGFDDWGELVLGSWI